MDLLKRELAPLAQEAWNEIDERAVDVLKTHLSARKVVRVEGPKGWDYTSISEGRLDILEDTDEVAVKAGRYKTKALVETRITFSLSRWEMDNILRGARDANLDALEDAMEKMALFEENAVYNSYEKGGIKGLVETAENEPVFFGESGSDIMASLSKAVLVMQDAYQEGPFSLVVGEEGWRRLNTEVQGYPLMKRVKDIIGGEVVFSSVMKGAVMVPYNHEDLELIIGGDFSIGYESHDAENVNLFVAESFTFRVLDPSLVVPFTL